MTTCFHQEGGARLDGLFTLGVGFIVGDRLGPRPSMMGGFAARHRTCLLLALAAIACGAQCHVAAYNNRGRAHGTKLLSQVSPPLPSLMMPCPPHDPACNVPVHSCCRSTRGDRESKPADGAQMLPLYAAPFACFRPREAHTHTSATPGYPHTPSCQSFRQLYAFTPHLIL
jgi:hypothetical protein